MWNPFSFLSSMITNSLMILRIKQPSRYYGNQIMTCGVLTKL